MSQAAYHQLLKLQFHQDSLPVPHHGFHHTYQFLLHMLLLQFQLVELSLTNDQIKIDSLVFNLLSLSLFDYIIKFNGILIIFFNIIIVIIL